MNEMILETLRGMLIGIPGVFAVLGIFYISLRIIMKDEDSDKDK